MRRLIVAMAVILTIFTLMVAGVWAQSTSVDLAIPLPSSIEIIPTECPCEVRLDAAPQGVSGFIFRFQDTERTAPTGVPLGFSLETGPGFTMDGVFERTVYDLAVADLNNDTRFNNLDILLFTYDVPENFTITRIQIHDDSPTEDIFLDWP